MSVMITIALILGLGHFSSASFFGLFSSPEPTRKPDVIVNEAPKASTDKIAYQNYIQSLARTNFHTTSPAVPIRYMPVYTYQPRLLNAQFFQPQQQVVYQALNTPMIVQKHTVQFSPNYNNQPMVNHGHIESKNSILGKPIVVLPSSLDETPSNISKEKPNLNILNQDSSLSNSKIRTYEFEIPEPQISVTLNDLPVSGISPDFRTGGYITKMMTSNSEDMHSDTGFGHAYALEDGTKVSEEGQIIKFGNGQETVLRRGHYEYNDASGKPVMVNWVADDSGFRLVY